MTNAARILGLFSVLINTATMVYVEIELSHQFSATWRLAILGSLVLMSLSQLMWLRSCFPRKGDSAGKLSEKLGLDLEG